MFAVAADGMSVIFSSHVLAELERICDYLVLLSRGRVQLAGQVDAVLAGHQVLTGPADQVMSLPATLAPVPIAQAGAQAHLLVRTSGRREPVPPGFIAQPAVLEELVLAYLGEPGCDGAARPRVRRTGRIDAMTSGLAAPAETARRRRIASRLTGPRRRRLPMLRLVWRQHWVALSVLLTLSAVAVSALVLSGIYYRGLGIDMWRTWLWKGYEPNYPDLAMQAVPLVAGLFVGVQLIARELDDGTAGFAWTQGYGKARWVLGKLAASAAVLVPAALVLGLVFGWWYRLYVPVTGYFTMHAFALYAPAMAGWTVAGLTLGMAAAALVRRESRAMWLTLAGWIALHHFAIVGSPRTPPGEFWPLQFAQLAILLAISGLLAGGTIMLIQDAPAIPGMPRLLRALPGRAATGAHVLVRQLGKQAANGHAAGCLAAAPDRPARRACPAWDLCCGSCDHRTSHSRRAGSPPAPVREPDGCVLAGRVDRRELPATAVAAVPDRRVRRRVADRPGPWSGHCQVRFGAGRYQDPMGGRQAGRGGVRACRRSHRSRGDLPVVGRALCRRASRRSLVRSVCAGVRGLDGGDADSRRPFSAP